MKKKLIIGLSMLGIATASVGTSLALLSSETDTYRNTMTVGSAKIEQLEYERAIDAEGNFIPLPEYTTTFSSGTYIPDEMVEFNNGKMMIPITVDQLSWDDRNGSTSSTGSQSHQQPWAQIGAPGSNQLFDADIANVIDKFVFVKNTGDTPVYFRTIIAIETPEGNEDLIGTNTNGNSRYDWNQVVAGNQYDSDSLKHEYEGFYAEIDGTRYYIMVATHTEALEVDQTARPSLLQVYLKKSTTNEHVERYGENVDILVVSQAVQTGSKADDKTGRSAAQVGLEEAFGRVTAENVADFIHISYE